MPKSRISLNIHAQRVVDNNRLMTHLKAIDPTTVLVLDGKGLGRDIKQALPECKVIIREFGQHGDDTLHLQMSPEEFLKQRAYLAEGQQYYLYTTNEPGFDQKIIDWHVRLMELAAKERVPLVVGNFAVGIPRPEDWPLARRMLELLDQHRDLFVLGLHEYGCGVMTSGLVGGDPTGMALVDGKLTGPHHPNYIIPENWPGSVQGITQFHCGRFNFLVQYCKSIGIRPPRVILTEHGLDDLSDIKFWSSTLKVRPGYLNIRGWKSLTDQWNDWYHARGWSPERAYFEQLKWADQTIYRNTIVEGQCIFSWGHSSNMWEQFDIAEALELQTLLEQYAQGQTPPVEPPPIVVDPPALPAFPAEFAARAVAVNMWTTYTVANIREKPTVDSPIVSKLERDIPVFGWVIPKADLRPDEQVIEAQSGMTGVWLPVRFRQNSGTLDGWVFAPLLTYMVVPNEPDDDTARRNVLNMLATVKTLLVDVEKLVEKI